MRIDFVFTIAEASNHWNMYTAMINATCMQSFVTPPLKQGSHLFNCKIAKCLYSFFRVHKNKLLEKILAT